MRDATKIALLYFVLPAWIAVGLADWFCHRASRIHETAEPIESAFHLVGLTQIGVPVLCGLFLETNALIIGRSVRAFRYAIGDGTVYIPNQRCGCGKSVTGS
jgi:purine-cytosine permease-like protein